MLIDPQFSKQQGREVTTYLVSPRGTSGSLHCSIQQAIDKADPYSRIVVQAGSYFESVNVTVPVEIVGDDGILPEIVCRGVGITVAVDIECYIENIKVTSKGAPVVNTQSTLQRGTNASVRVVSGMPTFFQCELTSVYVGGSAKPVICNCTISGSLYGPGLTVAEYASGVYKHNIISNHIPYCITVSSKSEPDICENEIFQNAKQISSAVHNAGAVGIAAHIGVILVTREGRDITRNVQPVFRSNTVRDETPPERKDASSPTSFKRRHALAERFATAPDFAAMRCCLRVDPSCTPAFHENVFSGGAIGILVKTGAGGVFENNNIHNASQFGVVLSHESFPTFRINSVSKCCTGMLAEGTAALLIHNTVRDNDGAGLLLLVGPKDDFRLEGNSFVANDTGVVVMPSTRKKATDEVMQSWLERQHRLHGRMSSEMDSRADSAAAPAAGAKQGDIPDGGDAAGGLADEASPEREIVDDDEDDQSPRRDVGDKHEMDASAPLADGSYALGAGNKLAPGHFKGTSMADLGKYSAIIGHSVISHNRVCGIAFIRPTFPVLLSDLDITQNGHVGALVSQGASPVFRGVRLDRGPIGIRVERSGRPVVRRCTLMNHSEAAVYVTEHGRGKYYRNIVVGFTHAGFLVDDGSAPEIYENAIRQSAGSGVRVEKGGIGIVRNNKLQSVAVGVEVLSYADPLVRENIIDSCGEMGVYVREEGLGTFVNNSFDRCHIGVGVATLGEPTLRDNRIERCVCVGFILAAGSRAIVEKNVVECCMLGGIMIEGADSRSHVAKNTVRKCGGFGIRSTTQAEGLVIRNRVSENADGGLSSAAEGNTRFEHNSVTSETGPGIKILERGRGTFVNNTIASGIDVGVELLPGSDAVLDNCVVAGNAKGGVRLHPKAGGVVKNCLIRRNKLFGMDFFEINCAVRTELRDLVVDDNGAVGLRAASAEACGTLTNVTVRNHQTGALLTATGRCNFAKCVFAANTTGVAVSSRGTSKFQDCTFTENSSCDVDITKDGDAVFGACTFERSRFAVIARNEARGEFTLCTFLSNSMASVAVVASSHPTVTKCTFNGCHAAFVGVYGAAANFLGNTINQCYGGAAIIALTSDASRIKSNTVTKSLGHSALIEVGARTVFDNNTLQGSARHGLVLLPSEAEYGATVERLRRDEASFRTKTIVPEAIAAALFVPTRPSAQPEQAVQPSHQATEETVPAASTALPAATPLDRVALAKLICEVAGLTPDDAQRLLKVGNAAAATFFGLGSTRTTAATAKPARPSDDQPQSSKARGAKRAKDGGADTTITSGELKSQKHRNASPRIPTVDDMHRGALVTGNTITDAAETGVFVAPLCAEGAFVMLRNTVQRCLSSGAVVSAGAKPLFGPGNYFEGNQNAAVVAAEFSEGEFHDSKFVGNSPCHVRLEDSSKGKYCGNQFINGEPHGIIACKSEALVLANKFEGHKVVGHAILVLAHSPKLTFEENILQENNAAIVVEGSATFTNNRIISASGVGLRVMPGAKPFVTLNTFNGCTVGVELDYDAGGSLSTNTFWKCHEGTVAIGDSITTKVERNHYEQNQYGLVLKQNDTLFVDSNLFVECAMAGVHADDGTRTKLHGNEFKSCAVGVLSTGMSTPRVFRNRFVGCEDGVLIRPSSGAKIEKSFFDRCSIGARCQSGETASIAALNCVFNSCTTAGWCSEGAGAPERVSRCLFLKCKDTPTTCAILLRDGGGGLFSDNDMHLNSIGVVSLGDAVGEVTKCFIHDNSVAGVMSRRGSTALTSCVLFNHRVADVLAGPFSTLAVKKCLLRSKRGIVLGAEASGTFANNTIRDAYHGVYVAGCGGASVAGNYITNCNAGVFFGPYANAASVSANHIQNCGFGVYSGLGASGDVNGNFITNCDTGVVLDSGALTTVMHCGLTRCQKAAITVRGRGGATVTHCRIFDNPGIAGVLCTSAASAIPMTAPVKPAAPVPVAAAADATTAPGLEPSPSIATTSPDAAPLELAPSLALNEPGVPLPPALTGPPPKPTGDIDPSLLPQMPTFVPLEQQQPPHTVSDTEMYQCVTNCLVQSGNAVLRRCVIRDAEMGMVIQADATASFEVNAVFDNTRCGVRLYSRGCTFAGNDFFSKDVSSALEMPPELQGFQLPKDNNVFNQCAGRAQPILSRAPVKVSELPQAVPARGRGDPTAMTQATLCTIHRDELPDFIPCGCERIPTSGDRSAAASSNLFNFTLDFVPQSGAGFIAKSPSLVGSDEGQLDDVIKGLALDAAVIAPPAALLAASAPLSPTSKSPRKPAAGTAKATPKPPTNAAPSKSAPRRK